MSDVLAHEQTESDTEHVLYPEHDERTVSPEFRTVRKLLIDARNEPCWKCVQKAWPDPPPPTAYVSREVHHYLVEWAAWKAVNGAKVQRLLDGGFFDPYGFAAQDKGKPFESPDDRRNMLVLCAIHHRQEGVGIHHATAPEWLSDALANEGVDILLSKEEWALLAAKEAAIGEDGKLQKAANAP